ncbi:MAG: signal recognition particle-docking protein FtsY [Flavobacteriales bacterium]|nr:signal recognition particle-docking protein FtsY [Flavobacteriales bacterium]MBR77662.1 signal recognition particle-docking protein FtsY [Flavobacteriales bacterium]
MGIFDKFKKIFNENNVDKNKKKKDSLSSKKNVLDKKDKNKSESEKPKDFNIEVKSETEKVKKSSNLNLELKADKVEDSENKPLQESNSNKNFYKENEPNLNDKKKKLDSGIKKTKDSFFSKLARQVAGKKVIDELVLDDIEEVLISSDIGVETSLKIIEKLEDRVKKDKYINSSELNNFLKDEISLLMLDNNDQKINFNSTPHVIMVVGVNGVGKTTTIGKLAHLFKKQGKKVLLGAADTFRAAAVDQLVIWSERVGVDIVKQSMGSDPASVCFDTLQSAKANNYDVVIIDTAGRLHNKINLMNELTKIKNVMSKVVTDAPHNVMLVLDASTGQNAIEQANQFTKATKVDSITLTKLDGTAKGGVVIGISDQFKIPVNYIGVGEGIYDLQEFNKLEFIDSLFKNANKIK